MPVPTTYDLGGFENMTGLNDMFLASDHVIFNGYLGLILIVALSALIFILSYRATNSPQKAFLATSFMVLMLSLGGWALQILSEKIMWVALFVFLLALGMTKTGD